MVEAGGGHLKRAPCLGLAFPSRRIRYLACNAFGSAASKPVGKVPTATNPQVDGLRRVCGANSHVRWQRQFVCFCCAWGRANVWRGTRGHDYEHVGCFS